MAGLPNDNVVICHVIPGLCAACEDVLIGQGFMEWAMRDLNPRPLACKASALPLS